MLNQLWRHALTSGAFAKEIARVRRLNVESAFLCGLLHAVGKPALLQLVNDIAKKNSLRVGPITLVAVLDDLHAVVGIRIAEQWGLPKPVAASIEHYASYAQAGGFRQEAMITFLADRLATHALEPARFGGDDGFRDTPVIADLNLYPDDVTGLLARRERVLELVAAMVACAATRSRSTCWCWAAARRARRPRYRRSRVAGGWRWSSKRPAWAACVSTAARSPARRCARPRCICRACAAAPRCSTSRSSPIWKSRR